MLHRLARGFYIPRLYADFNTKASAEYWNYQDFKPEWGSLKPYKHVEELGTGKFATVTKALNQDDDQYYTLKQLKPLKNSSMIKYNREIKVLQNLKGGPNIPILHDQVRNEKDDTVTLVLEYIDGASFREISAKLNGFEIRYYFYELLRSLDYAHSHGIMHRDLKPGNIMIDHKARKIRLIDWGLAEFYKPNLKHNLRVSTMNYKAPELLAHCKLYHYSIDSWSLGVTLAAVLFKKDPFFYGKDLIDQLLCIVGFCGTEALFTYTTKHNLILPDELRGHLVYEDKKDFWMYASQENSDFVTQDAIELLEKLLVMDHDTRILAREAMRFPFFKQVRDFHRKLQRGDRDLPEESLETARILLNSGHFSKALS